MTDQKAVDTLLRLAEEYGGHAKDVSKQGQEQAKGTAGHGRIQDAQTDLRVC